MTQRTKFVFDTNKCVGCQACSVACSIANNEAAPLSWRKVFPVNSDHFHTAPAYYLSMACNHCMEAPCLKGCPAKAIYRNSDNGAVLINENACIGCSYCNMLCPYDAPTFDERLNVMQKCTLCTNTLVQNEVPACVTGCPLGALQYEAGRVEKVEVIKDFNIGPAFEIIPLKENRKTPEYEYFDTGPDENEYVPQLPKKVHLVKEWPLAAFTFLFALSFSFYSALKAVPSETTQILAGVSFLLAGLFSLFHLKQKRRMWRAVLHVRHSWLSREIAGYTVFGGLAIMSFLFPGWVWFVSTLIFGLITLISIDSLYRVMPQTRKMLFPAGTVLLIAIYLSLVMNFGIVWWLLALRMILYVIQTMVRFKNKQVDHLLIICIRVLAGGILPLIFMDSIEMMALIFVAAGELIERLEFYMRLDLTSVAQQLHENLLQ